MNTLKPANRDHPFLQRLKAYLERSGIHCTERQMESTQKPAGTLRLWRPVKTERAAAAY